MKMSARAIVTMVDLGFVEIRHCCIDSNSIGWEINALPFQDTGSLTFPRERFAYVIPILPDPQER